MHEYSFKLGWDLAKGSQDDKFWRRCRCWYAMHQGLCTIVAYAFLDSESLPLDLPNQEAH